MTLWQAWSRGTKVILRCISEDFHFLSPIFLLKRTLGTKPSQRGALNEPIVEASDGRNVGSLMGPFRGVSPRGGGLFP